MDKGFEQHLALRYRRETRALEALLARSPRDGGPLQAGLVALHQRSARVRPVAEQLRRAEREGQLATSLLDLASSLLHMHVNRMLVSDHRAQELVLHDFLSRLYSSHLARRRKGLAHDTGSADTNPPKPPGME